MRWLWQIIVSVLTAREWFPEPVPDPVTDEPNPEPDPQPRPPDFNWSEQDRAILELLALIGSVEAPKGYDQLSGFAEAKVGRHRLTEMTLREVRDLQSLAISRGTKSSAAGRYQILRATLDDIVENLRLDWSTKFTPAIQDRMAWFLLERRGLKDFLANRITIHGFANNLAMEWAALPVVNDMQGANRWVQKGQSYYAGDGLNSSHLTPAAILSALAKINPEPATSFA